MRTHHTRRYAFATMLASVVLAAGCSSGGDHTSTEKTGDASVAVHPRDAADANVMFHAFLVATYDNPSDESDDWLVGRGSSGGDFSVFALATTEDEARARCDVLAPAIAWFFDGFDASLTVAGSVHMDDGTFEDADFEPVMCPVREAYDDPIVATAPSDPEAAVERASTFLQEYLGESFSGEPRNDWFDDVASSTSTLSISVRDGSQATGEHCADIEPLVRWLARGRNGDAADYELTVGAVECT